MYRIAIDSEFFQPIWDRTVYEIGAEYPVDIRVSSLTPGTKVQLVEMLKGCDRTGREIFIEIESVGHVKKGIFIRFSPEKNVLLTAIQESVEKEGPIAKLEVHPPVAQRHQSVQDICKYFTYAHLPLPQQAIVEPICSTIDIILAQVPDGPEVTVGLRKLLEAKDCFVRASLNIGQPS